MFLISLWNVSVKNYLVLPRNRFWYFFGFCHLRQLRQIINYISSGLLTLLLPHQISSAREFFHLVQHTHSIQICPRNERSRYTQHQNSHSCQTSSIVPRFLHTCLMAFDLWPTRHSRLSCLQTEGSWGNVEVLLLVSKLFEPFVLNLLLLNLVWRQLKQVIQFNW